MSICVVTHPIGATATATSDLLDILSAVTEVALVSANVSNRAGIGDKYEVIEVSEAGTGTGIVVAGGRFFINQFRMCRAIKERDEGIVWFFGATSYLLPILFAKLLGKTVVLQPRGDVPLTLRLHWEQSIPSVLAQTLAGGLRRFENIGYSIADAIVTYTPTMATELGLDQYDDKLYCEGARYIDTDQFSVQTRYKQRENVVGFVGRLDEEKGIRKLANISKELHEEVTFRFVGDGPLYEWLESELATQIETGDVELAGWVNHKNVPAELNRMKLLVMPSQPTEGLPTIILESMACGTPVCATPVSGVPDVVREGETGFLIGESQPEELAQFINAKLSQEQLSNISVSARQLILDEYSFEAAVSRYTSILSDL